MPDGMLWLAGVLAVLSILHLVASWAENRGWIHYRRPGKGGHGAALSNAMAEFEAVLNPAAEHRIEEERSQETIRQEAGSGHDRDHERSPPEDDEEPGEESPS